MKKTRSWDWILSIVGIGAAALTFFAFLFLSAQVNSTLEKVQSENSISRVSSVLQALDQNLHHLADYTTGYAMWDDAYKYLDTRDSTFLQTNFAPAVMAVSPAQLVAIYDLHGAMLFSAALDEKSQPFTPPAALAGLPALESFSTLRKNGDFAGRIEWIGGRPYLAAICPITDSSGQAPIRGYLLFGSIIGKKMLAQIQNLTGVQVSINADGNPPPGQFRISTLDLGSAEVTIQRHDDSRDATALAFFREDNSLQRSVFIHMRMPELLSRTSRQLEHSIRNAFIIVSAGFALFFVLAFREMHRRRADILRRINEHDELHAARQRAESLAEKAAAADQAKSAFLAMISHEIRTPLNAIVGYAELLRHDPAEELSSRLEIISKNGGVLQRILDDILDYSKIEAGKLNLHPRSVAPRRLLEEVVATHQNQAGLKRDHIRLTFHPGVPEFLLLDDLRLKQIAGNLLSNAIKFTDDGTIHLTLSAHSTPGPSHDVFPLCITVEDEGIGIPEAAEAALFSAFSQADSTTGRRYQGTGLGLAICRRLCTLMGGSIAYQRRSPCGSTFTVTLPAPITGAPAEPTPADPFGTTSPQNDLTVLIVDDNAVNARLLKAILKRLGRDSHIALGGQEAVDLFQRLHPDLIFMDIHMPAVDGLAATRLIRQAERDASLRPCLIVAVTADILLADRAQSIAAGMDGHINKPVDVLQISQSLSQAADRKHHG